MISLISRMQNKKETNEQTKQNKNKLRDTGYRLVVTRGEKGWVKGKILKGGQLYGDRRKLGFGC